MDNTQMTLTLASLLGPDKYKAFLDCFSRITLYHGRMPGEVAATILTLDGLQDIINTRRLSFPRCRLVRVGKPLNPLDYNERSHSALGVPVIKLIPDRVMKELRHGATLVLEFVEVLWSTTYFFCSPRMISGTVSFKDGIRLYGIAQLKQNTLCFTQMSTQDICGPSICANWSSRG